MRRTLVILLAVFLVIAVLFGAVSMAANLQKNKITYTENILVGDASAAEGITVDARYDYQNHLIWFSQHRPAETMETDTAFRYYTGQAQFDSKLTYFGVNMEVVDTWDMDWDWEVRNAEDPGSFTGLLKAYYDLYQDTEAGELTNTFIRYADHCDYYPLFGYVDAPADNYSNHWDLYTTGTDQTSGVDVGQVFNEYFRIPVLEDDWVQVVIDKRYSGSVAEAVDISNSRKGTDTYSMGGVGAVSGDTIYFTFNARTTEGNVVDTSLIPGGYGLYAIDYTQEKIDYESLRTLRPLDPTHSPVEMWVDESYDLLLLRTSKDNIWYLTVIDLETLETLQQLELMERDPEQYCWVSVQDGFLLSVIEDVSVSVYEQNEAGLYELRFTAPLPEATIVVNELPLEGADTEIYGEENYSFIEDNPIYNIGRYYSGYAFDGERLAVVSRLEGNYLEDGHLVWVEKAGYNLAVYTAEGLQFFGEYVSSLEPVGVTEYDYRKCWLDDISVKFDP